MFMRVVEGRIEIEKLKSNNPKTVQINLVAIHVIINHLRTQVLYGTADSFPEHSGVHAATKISDFYIVVFIE